MNCYVIQDTTTVHIKINRSFLQMLLTEREQRANSRNSIFKSVKHFLRSWLGNVGQLRYEHSYLDFCRSTQLVAIAQQIRRLTVVLEVAGSILASGTNLSECSATMTARKANGKSTRVLCRNYVGHSVSTLNSKSHMSVSPL